MINRHFSLFLKGFKDFYNPRLSLMVPLRLEIRLGLVLGLGLELALIGVRIGASVNWG